MKEKMVQLMDLTKAVLVKIKNQEEAKNTEETEAPPPEEKKEEPSKPEISIKAPKNPPLIKNMDKIEDNPSNLKVKDP